MNIRPLDIQGVFVIEIEKNHDSRGFFARSFDKKIFAELGLKSDFVQNNISFNKIKGTIRGMHYQKIPFQEAKLVRCVRGKVFEVVLDLRKDSKTYKKWVSEELSSNNFKLIYVPEGCALGFQTLEDETELFYQMSQYYNPEASVGVKWNDPVFNIKWPLEVTVISEKDSSFNLFSE